MSNIYRGSTVPGTGSTIRGKAEDIDIVDDGNLYDSTTVEDALQEIATTAIQNSISYNVETLAGNKTLGPIDKSFQFLATGGATRTISLDEGSSTLDDVFTITNTDTSVVYSLEVQSDTTPLSTIKAGGVRTFRFNGTTWEDRTLPETIIGDEAAGVGGSVSVGIGAISANTSVSVGEGASAALADCISVGKDATVSASQGVSLGSGATVSNAFGVAVGYSALSTNGSVAVGWDADATGLLSLAIGYNAGSSGSGAVAVGEGAVSSGIKSVSVGQSAEAYGDYSTVLGGEAQVPAGKLRSIALGYYSAPSRSGELSINVDGSFPQDFGRGSVGWSSLISTSGSLVEIPLAGSAGERLTLQANSVLAFDILVTGRDNTTGECAVFQLRGAAKRDGSNNTLAVGTASKDILGKDNAAFDAVVVIDDTTEAIEVHVQNANANNTQWVAQGQITETRF